MLRALGRKAYMCANKALEADEADDLTNWIDRKSDPEKGYSGAHTWTTGAPCCTLVGCNFASKVSKLLEKDNKRGVKKHARQTPPGVS